MLSECYLLCVFCLLCFNYSFYVFVIRFMYSFFVVYVLLYIFVFCVSVLLCVLFLLMYIVVPFIFVYKFTDHCHSVGAQLQLLNIIISYHIIHVTMLFNLDCSVEW